MPITLDRIDEFRRYPSRFLEEPEEEEHSLKGLPPLSFSVQETRAEMHRRLYQALKIDHLSASQLNMWGYGGQKGDEMDSINTVPEASKSNPAIAQKINVAKGKLEFVGKEIEALMCDLVCVLTPDVHNESGSPDIATSDTEAISPVMEALDDMICHIDRIGSRLSLLRQRLDIV